MALNLLPLCENVKIADRDGDGGKFAHMYLPFTGYWYANGQQLTFPNSQIPQNMAKTITGEYKNLPFHKDAGICIIPAV